MNLKKPSLLLIIILSMFISNAQVDEASIAPSSYDTQLVPNNPDVADLGKFGNLPVEQYNGSANISIPIHTLNFEGIQIPITASYNTGGVRVAQEASSIGLGWNLSEGFNITREIQGFDDLNSQDGVRRNVGWIYSDTYLEFSSTYSYNNLPFVIAPNKFVTLIDSYLNSIPHDTEPDLFTVNLPSGSVKFFLPKIQGDQTILTANVVNDKNFIVNYDINQRTFEIIDPSGFTYIFDVYERSSGFSNWDTPGATNELDALRGIPTWSTGQSRKVILNWKISEIISPFGKTLNFEYTDGLYCAHPSFSETSNIYLGHGNYTTNHGEGNLELPRVSASTTLFYSKYLNRISGDFGSIEFTLGDRLDISSKETINTMGQMVTWHPYGNGDFSAKKVDAITLKDVHDTTIKTIDFQYTYFNEDELNNTSIATKESYLRLKLDQIEINDQKYNFNYIQPNALPHKNTKSVDFWGFYNGITNSTLIPTSNRFYLMNGGSDLFSPQWYFFKTLGANRKSDFNYGKIGLLEEVTYPTGGHTALTYESHKATLHVPHYTTTKSQDGKIVNTSLDNSTDYNFKYQYLKLANDPNYKFYDNEFLPENCSVDAHSIIPNQAFEITDTKFCTEQQHNFTIDVSLICQTGCWGTTPSGPAVWLENIDTGNIQNLAFFENHDYVPNTPIQLNLNLSLNPGHYVVKTQVGQTNTSGTIMIVQPTVGAMYYTDNFVVNTPMVNYEEFEVGGARIHTLTHSNSNNDFISADTYEYESDFNAVNKSSGLLMDDLVYTSAGQSNYEYTPEIFATSGKTGCNLHSNNMIRQNNAAKGSHIGYSRVVHKKVDTNLNTNGYTENYFINQKNDYLQRHIGATNIFKPQQPNNTNNSILYEYMFPSELFIPGAETYYEILYNNTWDFYVDAYDEMNYGNTYIIGGTVKDYSYKNGNLIKSETFNKNGIKLSQVTNSYTDTAIDNPSFIRYPKLSTFNMPNGSVQVGYFHPFEIVDLNFLNSNRVFRLNKTESKTLLDAEPITNTVEYHYESIYHTFPTATKTVTSANENILIKRYYPQDMLSENHVSDLITANRLTSPILIESYIQEDTNLTLLTSRKTEFDYFSTQLLPKSILSLKGEETLANPFENRLTYHDYDEFGNPLELSKADGTRAIYIWGYNNTQPIAKIENASYQNMSTNLSNTISTAVTISNADASASTENNLRLALNNIRQHPELSQSMTTTYTYDLLIGVTSMTDSRGQTVYYEYDDFNRLKHIKDQDGNILSQNEYNYRQN